MNAPWTEMAVLVALILANGLFAMSEMAVVSARQTKLRAAAKAGDARAQAALALAESPTRFLSTVQIGISLIGIMIGAFGGASFTQPISRWLDGYPLLAPYSETIAFGLVVLSSSYLSLVLGELVPKRIALNNPERIAGLIAAPMRRLSVLISPLVHFLSFSTESVLQFLGQSHRSPVPISEEEIKSLILESNQAGSLASSQSEILVRVFQLGDRRAHSVMKPRPEIIWLDIDDPMEANWQKVLASGYSRYPVCRSDLDTLLGIVYLKDLLKTARGGEQLDLTAHLHQPIIVPETKPALEILDLFKKCGTHMAVVVNEFGGIEGIVTLGDILEVLVGYVGTWEQPYESQAQQREDGSWLFDGTLPIDEIKEHLNLSAWPDEEAAHYQTLGGFIMAQLGRIPATGERLEWAGLKFEVVDMDGRRIDKVLVTPQTTEQRAPGPRDD
jgi:putative hemolysin